ncbi:MAG: hypothetical protein Q9170_005757 [Blastenia crenularia]
MIQFGANEDHRLSSGTHAPEINHDLQAPEYRDDNSAPKMVVAEGAQVFYDRHPPEALAIDYQANASEYPLKTATRKPHTRLIAWFLIAAIMSIAIAPGAGLGVGLRKGGKEDARETGIPSSASTITTNPAPATNIDPVLRHGILDNASFATVTLPNNNRHMYFQEKTGALRRAIYPSQAKIWQTTSDPYLPLGAENNKPLAAIIGLNADRNIDWWIAGNSSYISEEPDDLNDVSACRHGKRDGKAYGSLPLVCGHWPISEAKYCTKMGAPQ